MIYLWDNIYGRNCSQEAGEHTADQRARDSRERHGVDGIEGRVPD